MSQSKEDFKKTWKTIWDETVNLKGLGGDAKRFYKKREKKKIQKKS